MQHLLLLHGAIGSSLQMAALEDALKENFQIHTLNFSGHGGSALSDEFSIERFAGDVLNYIAEQNIPAANIFGYSMGGYVALYLAKHHPEKVGSIFTFATKFEWTPEIAARETKMLDPAVIEEKVPTFAKQLENRHHPADWKEVLRRTAEMMTRLGEKNPLQQEDFKSIGHQILVGIGDRDTMVTLEETIAVYRNLPQGSLIVLPETPHPIEKISVERLANEIRSFFCP
jgi:pimeloyl-ACP methyl ester carboxylesterase